MQGNTVSGSADLNMTTFDGIILSTIGVFMPPNIGREHFPLNLIENIRKEVPSFCQRSEIEKILILELFVLILLPLGSVCLRIKQKASNLRGAEGQTADVLGGIGRYDYTSTSGL